MKKLLTIAMCGMAVMTVGAQKANVDQAKKLSGKPDKIEEARALIQEAIQNPETSEEALTYYTAGKIEWDSFDKLNATRMANPDKVNPVEMSNELLNGYNYFLKVFPLDVVPNAKGEVKPKYTKELQKKIAEKYPDFWEAGAVYYGEGMYFPQAYDAFMAYGDLPTLEVLGKERPAVPDTISASAYYNAGLCAWSASEVDKAAVAFKKASLSNYQQPESFIYEIACWQNIEQNDSTRENEARDNIYDAAKRGYERYGMEQPVFLNNMVNSMINTGRENDALAIVNQAVAQNPEKASVYGLRAYLYDRMKNDDASEADYRKAASLDDVDYETMRNATNKILRVGQEKWNAIEINDPAIVSKKADIRDNYFKVAKQYAEKAKGLGGDNSDIEYLIETVDYMLSVE